jgi:alginate O-acetyltransferase complex protein AlgI
MLFNSWQFAVFLPIVMTAYYLLPRRGQNLLLLGAGYFFYGCWDWRFCGLLAFSTFTDYWCGRGVETGSPRWRKLLLLTTLIINFSILGFFKYFNFFVDSAASLLTAMGLHANPPVLRVILPVGVSFYTFQSIAYVVDVYHGKVKAEKNFLLYAAFVSYFPQLVAGPIERASHLLTQLREDRVVDEAKFASGLMLMLIGFFKKMAIADSISPMIEPCFLHPEHLKALVLLKGIWLFSIQIYCDFSGYTDIARGVSRLLGIDLMENFNQPYFSRNITEFWRRWHISLSTWLRDYLYIPLGGNRYGTLKTYRNLMLTMIIGGLWHGANWTFVIWGTLHGVYLAGHKLMMTIWPPKPVLKTGDKNAVEPWTAWSFLMALCTFHLVMLTWVFFRAPDAHTAIEYLRGILTLRGGLSNAAGPVSTVAFYVLLLLLLDVPQYMKRSHTVMLTWPWLARGAAAGIMILLVLLLSPNHDTPFIYFQF